MRHNEIYTKLGPNNPSREIGFKITGNEPDHVWEDILLAMQGIPQGHFAFMMYVYRNDDHAKHGFFAELFMDVMQDTAVHRWILKRKDQGDYHREVEAMCQLAVDEWKNNEWQRATQADRAGFMGVSRGTWKRRYHLIYGSILTRPLKWEAEILKIVTDRLR